MVKSVSEGYLTPPMESKPIKGVDIVLEYNGENLMKRKFDDETKFHLTGQMFGRLDRLNIACLMMMELQKLLWGYNKKFRITIECNPEMNRYEVFREDYDD